MRLFSSILLISLVGNLGFAQTPDSLGLKIEFLSGQEAKNAILDETYEPYFSNLQIREIEAFVQEHVPGDDLNEARAFAREKFSSAVTDFTNDEKECIEFVLDNVVQVLRENEINLMANHPWKFIKIENWLCGGFAHTRGTYIILSQRHLDHLSEGWRNEMTQEQQHRLVKRLGGLLVHEQMHSLQRMYKSKFDILYTDYWNFVKADIEAPESIVLNQVSNPDAPLPEWIIPDPVYEGMYYWIRTLLKKGNDIPKMGADFIDKVYRVKKQDGVYRLERNSKAELVELSLADIEFYKDLFPTKRGLDHPNEISAYLFSDYFKSLLEMEKPFSDVSEESKETSRSYVDWIKKEMK